MSRNSPHLPDVDERPSAGSPAVGPGGGTGQRAAHDPRPRLGRIDHRRRPRPLRRPAAGGPRGIVPCARPVVLEQGPGGYWGRPRLQVCAITKPHGPFEVMRAKLNRGPGQRHGAARRGRRPVITRRRAHQPLRRITTVKNNTLRLVAVTNGREPRRHGGGSLALVRPRKPGVAEARTAGRRMRLKATGFTEGEHVSPLGVDRAAEVMPNSSPSRPRPALDTEEACDHAAAIAAARSSRPGSRCASEAPRSPCACHRRAPRFSGDQVAAGRADPGSSTRAGVLETSRAAAGWLHRSRPPRPRPAGRALRWRRETRREEPITSRPAKTAETAALDHRRLGRTKAVDPASAAAMPMVMSARPGAPRCRRSERPELMAGWRGNPREAGEAVVKLEVSSDEADSWRRRPRRRLGHLAPGPGRTRHDRQAISSVRGIRACGRSARD